MKKLLLAAYLIAFSNLSLANQGGWTPYQKISAIIVENGIALILLEGGVDSTYVPSACNNSYNQAVLSTEHGKAVYSLALSAYMVGKPISIALGCSGSRPLINLIKV